MNLLFRILYAQKCPGTHHKLAMDALRYLKSSDEEDWVRLFLSEIEQYTIGAKAPDRKFRDFRNHVLHVGDNYWGGAVKTAQLWYERLVTKLQQQDWSRAIYCAGVLSHYITDPLMPLHTGQTEDEGQVHKFVEWGTSKIYGELVAGQAAARVLQNWSPPSTTDTWLADLITTGAETAHDHYDVMIDHYDPAIGRNNAAAGFDSTSRESIAQLLAWSIRALAFALNQAIHEASVTPPKRRLSVATVLSGVSTPIFWITRKLESRADRKAVKAIWEELQATGKVVQALPEDDKVVRAAHAKEVLQVSVEELDGKPVRRAGRAHRKPSERLPKAQAVAAASPVRPGFRLNRADPVVDAPSIGPKTAARLDQIGIETVAELLTADAEKSVARLRQRWITREVFTDWQRQAALQCEVPGVVVQDVQLLVAVDVDSGARLYAQDSTELAAAIQAFCETKPGQRILRSSKPPGIAEVEQWISWAATVQPTAKAA